MEMKKLKTNIIMPAAYYISYMYEGERGVFERIIKAKNTRGDICYQADNKKHWFARNGVSYRHYFLEENGLCVLESDRDYSEHYVDDITEKFDQCAQKSVMPRIRKSEQRQELTIAGRDCEEFAVKLEIAVFGQEFLCAVDKKSGICLRWEHKTRLNGFEVAPAGNFICEEFLTEHVDERLASVRPERKN